MSEVTPRPGDPTITSALVAEHGLTKEEYERLIGMLGRAPTFTELGIVSALWSEHCPRYVPPAERSCPVFDRRKHVRSRRSGW